MNKVLIIIDGSNFYHRLKEAGLKNLLRFGYRAFSDFLVRGRIFASRTYYKVEYVGFSHKPSHALITHSDIRRLLTKEDLEPFLIENAQ